jgi:hypothetical protein
MPFKNKCDFLLKALNRNIKKSGSESEIIRSYLTECQRLCFSVEKDDFKCKNFMSIMKYIIETHPTPTRSE